MSLGAWSVEEVCELVSSAGDEPRWQEHGKACLERGIDGKFLVMPKDDLAEELRKLAFSSADIKTFSSLLAQIQCKKHPGNDLHQLCTNDHEAVCRECLTSEHAGHEAVVPKDVLQQDSTVVGLVTEAREMLHSFESRLQMLIKMEGDVIAQEAEITNRITEFFVEVERVVKRRSLELIQRVTSSVAEKLHSLQTQRARMEPAVALVKQAVTNFEAKLQLNKVVPYLEAHKILTDAVTLGKKVPSPPASPPAVLEFVPNAYKDFLVVVSRLGELIAHNETAKLKKQKHEPFLGHFRRQWGKSFVSQPTGICYDGHFFYVTDYTTHCVCVFDGSGGLVRKFGNRGSDKGQLSEPVGIAADETALYVCDKENSRIQVLSKGGAFLRHFGSYGSEIGQFCYPTYIAVHDDLLYISDNLNNRVQVCTKDGRCVRSWGSKGSGEGQFNQVGGISVVDNSVFVADLNNNRIQIFDLTGKFVRQFGSRGSAPGQIDFGYTNVGVCASHEFVYVSDAGNHRVQVFTHHGGFVGLWGGRGDGEGQFRYPHGICNSGAAIHVVDKLGARIQTFE